MFEHGGLASLKWGLISKSYDENKKHFETFSPSSNFSLAERIFLTVHLISILYTCLVFVYLCGLEHFISLPTHGFCCPLATMVREYEFAMERRMESLAAENHAFQERYMIMADVMDKVLREVEQLRAQNEEFRQQLRRHLHCRLPPMPPRDARSIPTWAPPPLSDPPLADPAAATSTSMPPSASQPLPAPGPPVPTQPAHPPGPPAFQQAQQPLLLGISRLSSSTPRQLIPPADPLPHPWWPSLPGSQIAVEVRVYPPPLALPPPTGHQPQPAPAQPWWEQNLDELPRCAREGCNEPRHSRATEMTFPGYCCWRCWNGDLDHGPMCGNRKTPKKKKRNRRRKRWQYWEWGSGAPQP